LPKGGIETFFVRMASRLSDRGHTLKFLFFTDYCDLELLVELEKSAKIYFINEYLFIPTCLKNKSPLIKLFFPLKNNKIARDILSDVDHIHLPDYNSILYYKKVFFHKYKWTVSIGVYHINEFVFRDFETWYFGKKIKELFQNISPNCILFFNEISRELYNSYYHDKFKESLITPIGIDVSKYQDDYVGIQNNRVVSIGRLSSWKKYNFHMIEAVHVLQQQGITIQYDSYGDGDQLELLNSLVANYNLSHLIKFHKGIPYSKFKEAISNSLMFIGAGTSLVEASACGIPALIGIENESYPVSYGFLHNLSSYSYQERELQYARIDIVQFILQLLNCDELTYKKECERARSRSSDFSIDKSVVDFEKLCGNAENVPFNSGYIQLVRIIFSMMLNRILCSNSNYSNRL
jgi:glycosyltransferase involved in cell wall biosynthesis